MTLNASWGRGLPLPGGLLRPQPDSIRCTDTEQRWAHQSAQPHMTCIDTVTTAIVTVTTAIITTTVR
jgi:hypothetical protein